MKQQIVIAQTQNEFVLPPPVDSQPETSQTTITFGGEFPSAGSDAPGNMDYVFAGICLIIFLVLGLFLKSQRTISLVGRKVHPSSAKLSGLCLLGVFLVLGISGAVIFLNKSLLSAPLFLVGALVPMLLLVILTFTTGRK